MDKALEEEILADPTYSPTDNSGIVPKSLPEVINDDSSDDDSTADHDTFTPNNHILPPEGANSGPEGFILPVDDSMLSAKLPRQSTRRQGKYNP